MFTTLLCVLKKTLTKIQSIIPLCEYITQFPGIYPEHNSKVGFPTSPRWYQGFLSVTGNGFPEAPRNNSCLSHGGTALQVFTPRVAHCPLLASWLLQPVSSRASHGDRERTRRGRLTVAAPPHTDLRSTSPNQYCQRYLWPRLSSSPLWLGTFCSWIEHRRGWLSGLPFRCTAPRAA